MAFPITLVMGLTIKFSTCKHSVHVATYKFFSNKQHVLAADLYRDLRAADPHTDLPRVFYRTCEMKQ